MMKADIQQTSDSCHHILNRSRKKSWTEAEKIQSAI